MATYIKPEAIKDSSLPIEKIDNVALDLADKVNALSDEGKNTFLNKIGLGKIGVISQKQNWTSDYSSYTISDVVRGIIPQYIIDYWCNLTYGKTFEPSYYIPTFSFNEETGYFEVDDLKDITLNDAIVILLMGNNSIYLAAGRGNQGRNVRVVFDLYVKYSNNLPLYCGMMVERVLLSAFPATPRNYQWAQDRTDNIFCQKLKVVKYLQLDRWTTYSIDLSNLINLETFFAAKLTQNILLNKSSRLSNESILYMINYERATSPITITLHADAYARAMADAEILAALETHTNVSLASA